MTVPLLFLGGDELANVTPDVRILVGDLGDASPSGRSANLIRKNLETALADGIKIKIIPDTSALTGTVASGSASATSKQSAANTAAIQKETQAHLQNAQAKIQSAAASSSGTQSSNVEANAIKNKTNLLGQETAQRRINTQAKQDSVKASLAEAAATAKATTAQVSFQNYLTSLNPKALTQFSAEIAQINRLLGTGTKEATTQANLEIQKLKAQMKSLGYEGGTAFTTLLGKLKTYTSYFASSMIVMGLYSGITNLISNVKDLDEAMTDLRIVTGGTREETEELLSTYNKMAQQLGTTTVSVSEGAVDWLRQGYSEEDARELLKQSMTLSIVGAMDSADATDALTAALKGYRLQVSEASDVVDKFFTVDMAAATSSENMALALAKTAANAKLAGLSLDDVIGQLARVNEVMKEDGSSTGGTMRLAA